MIIVHLSRMLRSVGHLALTLTFILVPAPLWATGPLVICYGSLASALIPLADLEHRYTQEGLEVQTRRYPSGFQALEAMLGGDCTMAAAAVPPVVFQALQRTDFRILAAISSSGDFERIIARRDRGIRAPADLRGHRIAVAQATSAHYFLDMYLAANGLTPADVTQVFLPPQDLAGALQSGAVDAVAYWEPSIRHLAAALGPEAEVFSFPGLVVSPFLLLARESFARDSPAAVDGVLRALLAAERSLAEQPAAAARLLAPAFGISPEEYEFVKSLHEFRVSLDRPLPFILENAARWEIGLAPPGARPPMPDFLRLIDLRGMRAVNPQGLSIVE